MPAPFPIDPHLTGIAIAYHNEGLIADSVLPRVSVGKESFKYQEYNLADNFTLPDTRVGRKSEPNQVEFGSTEKTASTEDYGLDDLIPYSDVANASENQDPEGQAVESLTNLIELSREVRTASVVFNASSYAAGNINTLSGTSQFSDYANSDPIRIITEALDSMIMRANVMTLGREVYSKLSRHPLIVKAFHGNSGDSGIVTRQFLAELFELDEVLVGSSRLNISKPGQSPTLNRVWGKHISLTYRDSQANTRNGTTFGFTAQFQDRVAGSMPEPTKGLRGGTLVRSGESVKELVVAKDLGYFIQNAIA